MRRIYTMAILVWTVTEVQGQTQLPSGLTGTIDENYVYTRTYLEPKTQSDSNAKQIQAIQYFDGLGRAKQTINIKASPKGRDIVTPFTYDYYGKPTRDYLPVPQSGTQNGKIYSQNSLAVDFPVGDPEAIYSGERPFTEKVLEKSPLDRLQQQIQVGNDWASKPVTFKYESNKNGEVKKYTATFSYTTFVAKLILSASYGSGQLFKNTVTDEDGNQTIEFKNSQGQVVLVRKVISDTENADTYYVYNDYNQLAFVIPPKAAIQADANTVLNELCYQYKYDEGNRLVEKKLPGKGWEYMVYNKADQLILNQDTVLKDKGQWLFTKYDQFGRIVYTGITNNPASRASMQNSANINTNLYETRTSTTGFILNGLPVYYTKLSTPTGLSILLSVNYYDSYPTYSFNPALPVNTPDMTVLTGTPTADGKSTKGLPVMSFVKNIEDDNWTKNYTYYDQKGRVIGSHSINHLGGYTRIESELDFTGMPQKTVTTHKRLAGESGVTITEHFEYDNQYRLLVHKHQVDDKPEQILTENSYNELSQLNNKKVGNNLQSIDYTYNIRGWLTGINKAQMAIPDLGGKLFSYIVKYNQINGIENPDSALFNGKNVKPRYNGNIAEVDWRAVESLGANPPIAPKRYGYVYDALNRLTAGYYQNPVNPYSKEHTESLAYDLNGNITNLYRTSAIEGNNTTATVIDELEYTYGSNNLTNQASVIKDYKNNPSGYEGGGGNIQYDLNGNMWQMPDKNITKITYNHLNLPNKIEYGNLGLSGLHNYLYSADGVRLQKKLPKIECGIINCYTVTEITDYLDGFQYYRNESDNNGGGGIEELSMITEKLKYAYEQQAYSTESGITMAQAAPLGITAVKTPQLMFFPTAEGFYDYGKDQYIYQYKDHLGNARISYARNSAGSLEITDANDYYPFGMNHLKTGNAFFGSGSYKNYKYNGKELQETGMYDYGARFYMADIGRWGVLDNYSENYFPISPYSYVANNPTKFIDINGEWIYINDQNGTQYRYHNGATQHQVDGKWTNVDASTQLSDYVVQTIAGLNHLDKNTSIGKTMIGYFDQAQGKDGKIRDIYFNSTSDVSHIKYGISNIIELNPSDKGVWTTLGNDSKYTPLYTTIAHEMGHIYENYALGITSQSDTRFGPNSTTAEIYGTHVENIVRAESGLPLRTNYGSTCGGSTCIPNDEGRLIDNAGSSIYYNKSGGQISPTPSVESILKINGKILQNRYNYIGAAGYYKLQKFKNRPR
ncbi:DUF6443 domain-containing protein [Chryseobacterium sp. AG844]|uniref:DUF6443 domain-containing protein n=1 Tax=Chryseobacterium sp. AG844 TaxID=2183998 RepID=UPI000D8A7102|nr:DUF6443 domain-containing protein [Chryseobacterium sp. AG844]PWW30650.1 RHS repeat-associated protein [Chryseobacterium sp. AG844]